MVWAPFTITSKIISQISLDSIPQVLFKPELCPLDLFINDIGDGSISNKEKSKFLNGLIEARPTMGYLIRAVSESGFEISSTKLLVLVPARTGGLGGKMSLKMYFISSGDVLLETEWYTNIYNTQELEQENVMLWYCQELDTIENVALQHELSNKTVIQNESGENHETTATVPEPDILEKEDETEECRKTVVNVKLDRGIEEKNKKILKQLIIIELKMKNIHRKSPDFEELWI
ncbi:hypothetical protein BB558_002684 [Smittium angustum]|uniref:Uncharacterized protein n=1 Tax=Smittium angustum TaxID=133377 RepID=A0A2U1J8E2_SMIAN|nr:hypothetical protein BB558_002684 [Smittium angustum]